MLLKVGTAMMIAAVALTAVVAVALGLSGILGGGEETASEDASLQPVSAEAEAGEERAAFDPGQKLEIDRKKPKAKEEKREPLPVAAEDWPEPSGEEVAAVEAPATTRLGWTRR
jgi:hypothetical protein